MKKKKKVAMEQQSFPLNKEEFFNKIAFLLANKVSFVLFKKPLESAIYLLVHNSKHDNLSFTLQGFANNVHTSIHNQEILVNEKILELDLSQKFEDITSVENVESKYSAKRTYIAYVKRIIEKIAKNRVKKVVAARKKKLVKPKNFKAEELFVRLCENYPKAFVHLSYSSLGLWIGASPELLLKKENALYHTVALAGTKLTKENRKWTSKEEEEQEIVSEYIKQRLEANKAKEIKLSSTYTASAGHLEHLKTDISFRFDGKLDTLLMSLHPTPAVCGLPLKRAQKMIFTHEKNQRSLYSGFLGLDSEEFYYVNLRCMQIFDTHIDVYVGAGITLDSIPEKEWLETEAKALTLEKFLY
ncbi:MAG: chorismate-binding protein [Chitinophagales bacterium]|nr:chorismate-binding protein [Chitinophagales bacterium]